MLKRTPLKQGKPLKSRSKPKTPRQRELEVQELHSMWKIFLEIWEERKIDGRNYSEISGKYLGSEPLSVFFDHALEKSVRKDLKFEKGNIILCTFTEHQNKGGPKEHPKFQELINKIKEKYGE